MAGVASYIDCPPVAGQVQDASILQQHQNSASHRKAETLAKAVKDRKTVFGRAVEQGQQALKGFLKIALSAALFIIMHNYPITHLSAHLAFLAFHKVADANKHKWSAMRYMWGLMRSINEVILAQQLARITASSYYSIMIDSSTDVSTQDAALVFIRYFDTAARCPRTELLCAVHLAGKSANDVFLTLVSDLNEDFWTCNCAVVRACSCYTC